MEEGLQSLKEPTVFDATEISGLDDIDLIDGAGIFMNEIFLLDSKKGLLKVDINQKLLLNTFQTI